MQAKAGAFAYRKEPLARDGEGSASLRTSKITGNKCLLVSPFDGLAGEQSGMLRLRLRASFYGQEVFCAAVRTQSNFRRKSSERSWLCGILKNKICDYFRKLGRETCFTDLEFLEDEMSHKFIDQGWNHDRGPAEWKSEAEVVMDRAEFWKTFRDCLSKLPARVGDVFMLREMEEMETAQICEALRISQNNLWVMLHRARMALRECLELNWFENKPKLETDG
jgi:RNA polymerase sigma-70 factor (TIGR02943 family)